MAIRGYSIRVGLENAHIRCIVGVQHEIMEAHDLYPVPGIWYRLNILLKITDDTVYRELLLINAIGRYRSRVSHAYPKNDNLCIINCVFLCIQDIYEYCR